MASLIDTVLEKFGVKYEELSIPEKDTLFAMVSDVQKSRLTVEKIEEYITSMRQKVELELVNEPEFNYIFIFKVPNRKQLILKAHLKNYLLLEAVLTAPKKAEKMLEESLAQVKKKGSE